MREVPIYDWFAANKLRDRVASISLFVAKSYRVSSVTQSSLSSIILNVQ